MTKIKISFITWLLISFASVSYSQSGWVDCTPISSTGNFASISFLNDNTGFLLDWVCGVYRTTNGGLNWVRTTEPLYYDVWDIEFVNEQTGFICGDYYCSILKTTNGGYNWEIKKLIHQYLYDIKFVNQNTGYAVGNPELILKTTNAGENWESLSPPGNTDFHSISIVDTSNIYVAGGYTVYSSNGGYNWSVITSGQAYGNFVFFTSASSGILADMRYTNSPGRIFKTTDLGNSWTLIKQDTISYYDVYFTDYNKGYVCGTNSVILKTTDAGSNWHNQYSIGDHWLIRVKFTSQNTGYCVGEDIVLKTTTGGEPIGIHPISNETPNTFSLSQNYPNPFNPVTKIKFQAPLSPPEGGMQEVTLTIYDVLGKEVAIVFTSPWGRIGGATYEAEWDASNYPSGVYFYRLTASDYSDTKKMVLIK